MSSHFAAPEDDEMIDDPTSEHRVVGGAQAGLSVGHHLTRRAIEPPLGLRLRQTLACQAKSGSYTPRLQSRVPGVRYGEDNPDGCYFLTIDGGGSIRACNVVMATGRYQTPTPKIPKLVHAFPMEIRQVQSEMSQPLACRRWKRHCRSCATTSTRTSDRGRSRRVRHHNVV
ncbi:MAG: hypothetical protein JO283_16425 [Bradyrhizobium sp.]|nr:hypothetical protein [Bradyrhizobium sp.]